MRGAFRANALRVQKQPTNCIAIGVVFIAQIAKNAVHCLALQGLPDFTEGNPNHHEAADTHTEHSPDVESGEVGRVAFQDQIPVHHYHQANQELVKLCHFVFSLADDLYVRQLEELCKTKKRQLARISPGRCGLKQC